MKNYGYRFSCRDSNVDYLSCWGFETIRKAEKELNDIAHSCFGPEGSCASGAVYKREGDVEDVRVTDLNKYEYFVEKKGFVLVRQK